MFLNSSVQQTSSDSEFPELQNIPFLLQAGAPQQQLHLGWGSNINFGSDPANTSAPWALSAPRPLLVCLRESHPHSGTAMGSHSAVALRCSQNQALCAEEHWGSWNNGASNPTVSQPTGLKGAESAHMLISPRQTNCTLHWTETFWKETLTVLNSEFSQSLLPHFPLSPLVVSTVLCCRGVQLHPLPWELPLVPLEVLLAEAALQHRRLVELCSFGPHGSAVWAQLDMAVPVTPRKTAGEQWALCLRKVHGHSPTPLTQQNVKINGACKRLKIFQAEQGLKFRRHFIRKHDQWAAPFFLHLAIEGSLFPSPELSKLSHPLRLLSLQGMHPVGQRSVLLESPVPDISSSPLFVTWPLPLLLIWRGQRYRTAHRSSQNENRHQTTQAAPASRAHLQQLRFCMAFLKQSQDPTLSSDSTVLVILQILAVLPGYLLPKSSVNNFSTLLEMKEKAAYLIHPSLGGADSLVPSSQSCCLPNKTFLTSPIQLLLLLFLRVLG